MIKKILRPILITLIQLIVLVIIHNALYRLYPMNHTSVAFGITNLLPIPALDGGRILFIIPELIFRKRVPAKYENFIHFVGFVLLIGFMIYVTFQDIFNPITIP